MASSMKSSVEGKTADPMDFPDFGGARGATSSDRLLDVDGFALAVRQGFSTSASNYVWYMPNPRNGKYQIFYKVAEDGRATVLLDLAQINSPNPFLVVNSNGIKTLETGVDPGLTADNVMDVVRFLCTFTGKTLASHGRLEVPVEKYGWTGKYTCWVEPDQLRVRTGRSSYTMTAEYGGRTYRGLSYPEDLRFNFTSESTNLRATLEASQNRVQQLEGQLNEMRSNLKRVDKAKKQAERNVESFRSQSRGLQSRISSLERGKKAAEDATARVTRELNAREETLRLRDRRIRSLEEKNREQRSENKRLDSEMGRVCRENRRFQETQRDYENRKMEFESFKRAKVELEQENSRLRDKVSELKGGSRRLASPFWTRKEVKSAFGELGDEYHMNLWLALGSDLEDEEIHALLLDVLFAVRDECNKRFDQIADSLCFAKTPAIRNEFMSKIQEYFEELLDISVIVSLICETFSPRLGHHVEDESFVEYVERCAKLCWVLALKSDPKMEFYRVEETVLGEMTKDEFDSIFVAHSDCRVKKAERVRVLQYVLPGLRRVDDGQIELRPCVMAEQVREEEKAREEESKIEDPKDSVKREANVPRHEEEQDVGADDNAGEEQEGIEEHDSDALMPDAQGTTSEHEAQQEGKASAEDETTEKTGIGADAVENEAVVEQLQSVKVTLEKMLSDGDAEDAFDLLEECGLVMRSGRYNISLKCVECGNDAGTIMNDPDVDFGCGDNARHTQVEMSSISFGDELVHF